MLWVFLAIVYCFVRREKGERVMLRGVIEVLFAGFVAVGIFLEGDEDEGERG